MDVQLLNKQSLRIKGKRAAVVVNPSEKAVYNAVILLGGLKIPTNREEETVVIQGAGEYEIGGIKITGIQADTEVIFSMKVDGIDILIGKIVSLEKMQHKVKDHNVVIAVCDEVVNASFVTSLADNVVLFSGEKAGEVVSRFGKEGISQSNKYTTTLDKLPPEVETVLLA